MSDTYTTQDLQDNLDYLNETKTQIKNAIINKGQEVSSEDTFRSYADKIEAIQTSENLDTELNTQDQKIEDIKTALNGRTGEKLNIFAQIEEPPVTKGIWLQTDKQVDNIIQDENVFTDCQWNVDKMATLSNLPKWGEPITAACVGDYIYFWGNNNGGKTSTQYAAYKYNIKTNTYISITDSPIAYTYSLDNCYAVAIGTDIHLFGGAEYSRNHYLYNTLTDTYTSKASIPLPGTSTKSKCAGATAYGTDIYLYVLSSSSTPYYVYKYDTLTNTYDLITSSLGCVQRKFTSYSE